MGGRLDTVLQDMWKWADGSGCHCYTARSALNGHKKNHEKKEQNEFVWKERKRVREINILISIIIYK